SEFSIGCLEFLMQQLGSLSTPSSWLSLQVKQCFASSIGFGDLGSATAWQPSSFVIKISGYAFFT
ncbi:hypothetical protein, partial [Leptolyngbya sp. FACHB-321]|uniref:hypothetical protein n=1 Tax=Leptolyngbya sp. FACHB-321 TaxID=2692807 RepID=UPI001A7EF052